MGMMIGDYEIIEKLGSGAMGEVFKCKDRRNNNRIVALKILSEDLTGNSRAIERFEREIKQGEKLKHPNIIRIFGKGEFKKRLFYVMEYVEGITAKKELLIYGPYNELRAIEVVIQVSKALEYASRFGIIHRDIKPDNIMITYDGRVKLCDLGLAKSTQSSNDPKVTILGTVLGTPHYMSPEQARGDEDLDSRSDIFSLGATFYHLLTGSPPFEGSNPIAIMEELATKEPIPIQDRNPKISDATCAIIAKMMAKDRNKRYQSFTELLQDLYRLKRREPTLAQRQVKLPPSKLKLQKFKECFAPSEEDVLIAQIALHNKLLNIPQVEQALLRQESLSLVGASLSLSDVLVEQNIISPQQKLSLEKTKVSFMLNRIDELLLKLGNNLLSTEEINTIREYKNANYRGIGGILVANNYFSEEKREKIYAIIKKALQGEEIKSFIKLALESKIISKPQADKCLRIYNNNIVMGKYKEIGPIFLEKGYLVPEAVNALLRAVRRSILTKKPAFYYLNEVKLTK